MAISIPHLRSPIISSAASINPPRPRSTHSISWWAPIFGWSPEPDYINGSARTDSVQEKSCFRGRLTEEKAKELRKKTVATSSFHDIMYHSAIASRLASDVSGSMGDNFPYGFGFVHVNF
ncbi:uncharacterized protein [Henckelia pumila]|uniref:uncharacterized protein n=1 Tax=Henckelia pumila TaxID=405737 RepID=UPI003C6E586F